MDRRFLKKIFSPLWLWTLLKPNDRQYLVNFDPRCMVGRIYGSTSCGSHGLEEDFWAINDSKASTDNRSMGGRIYVGDHKTYIYKLWVSPFQRKRFLSFSHYKLYICQSAQKPHATFPFHIWWCFICNLTKISPLVYFFENVNGRCRHERWTIGTLTPHVSFRGHVS